MTETATNEDRVVLDVIENAFDEWSQDYNIGEAKGSSAEAIRDALVSHGWGRKPRLANDQLAEIVDGFAHECRHCPADRPEWVVFREQVWDLVRACGVEVSDD